MSGSQKAIELLQVARALSPMIRGAADDVERQRLIPANLLQRLKDCGLFRMWFPTAVGGDELDPVSTMRVIEELATADASVGWAVMVANQGATWFSHIDRDSVLALLDRDDIVAGSLGPAAAVPVDGGYRVTGQFGFVSGCHHATIFVGMCRIVQEGQPRLRPNGMAEQRAMVFRKEDWHILDTWHTTGLRGSGSDDVEVVDAFVPETLVSGPNPFADPETMARRWGGPLYEGPFIWPMRGAQALGIARHALAAFIELASEKKPFGVRDTLQDLPRVQAAVARAEAALASVRAYLYETVEEVWDVLVKGQAQTPALLARIQLATAYTAETSADVASAMYRLGGGSAIYAKSPLDRCFRDANTLMADQAVAPRLFEQAGRVLLGAGATPRPG